LTGWSRVPEWEELGYTPYVFVRVASKGLIAYGKLKSVEVLENKGFRKWRVASSEFEDKEGGTHPPPICMNIKTRDL
jgi:hypothetical protein